MPNPILDKITVNDIEYDLVGNGGGHVIEKSDGTDMTQRSNLQFVDAQLTDDSTNDRTKVENVKIIQNESELANLPDGIYMGAQDEAIPFSFEAEDISYDNTTSQLTATDVQAAIDELSQKEAGVQSDWNEADNTKLDYIKNKPANLVQDASYVHTDNNYTSTEKTKLGTIAEGAEINVQSDWSQTDNTADDYIKNKPTIPDAQIQSDWNQTSGTAKDFIKNKPTLGTASALDVATSGDASSTQVVKGDDSRLSDARTPVAHNHTVSEITDFPTLGTASALDVATSGDASSTQVVKGDDSRLTDARTPVSHTHTLSEITDAGSAASKDSTSSVTADSTDLVESGAVKTAIDNAISGAYKHAGTKTCAELISSLLIASNNGNVYNITDSGTTTADFIEGAGIPIRAGDNVGIAKISDSIYKFDLLSGFIDTSNFVTKSSTSGLIKNDGSIDTTEYAPASSIPAAQIQSDWSQSDNTKLDYIKNKPTLGSAASKNVPSSGDAGNSEVVLGNDSRLTDARNAADVYSWAKAENKPSYSKSEVGLGNVDNTSDATKKSNFTGSIASGNTGFVTGGDVYSALGDKVDKVEGKTLSSNDYTNTDKGKVDTLGTASTKDVPTSGNASTSQVVMGSDTRLTDARPASDVSAWAKTSTKPSYTKSEVGLGNVDNTSDADKPISTATQTALDNKVDKDGNKVLSTNDYTTAEKNKLAGIAEGAEVNVQTDWNQSDDTADDYLKNKPEAYDAIWQNNDILEGVSDVQPYLYRAANKPEGAIEYVQEKLIGASAAVNQIIQNGNFVNTNNWVNGYTTIISFTVNNNIATFKLIAENATYPAIKQNVNVIKGHKYLLKVDTKASKTITGNYNICFFNAGNYSQRPFIPVVYSTSWVKNECIVTYTENCDSLSICYADPSMGWTVNDEIYYKNLYCIDLTQMFGTAIADLAYSKEQASAGSGIAWLKSYGFFTKDYYPYNTGALQSVKTGSKKVVGKNLFNLNATSSTKQGVKYNVNTDGTIDISGTPTGTFEAFVTTSNYILPIGNYIINGLEDTTNVAWNLIRFYKNGSQVSYIQPPSNNEPYAFEVTSDDYDSLIVEIKRKVNDTPCSGTAKLMIRLASIEDDSFEPYTSTTYPLDSDLELRGLYKLDASNNIVCDGDEYTPDGSVKRRYGIVDLGSLSWTKYDTTSGTLFRAFKDDIIYYNNQFVIPNFICSKYITISSDIRYEKTLSQAQAGSGCVDIVDSSYTDVATFKTAMSGVYLIYELATSTTDSAASYQNPQIIHENGTEEFIDTRDYPLPVGHDTGYFTASDEKFFLPPVVDNDGRFLYHDGDGFQFKNFDQVASKVEESDTNGNIKINDTETQVYDDSEIKGELSTDTTTIEGNPLNFTTLSAQTAKSTILSVEPIQDLHGYDKPWVGGAGKNLLQVTTTTQTVSGVIFTVNDDGTIKTSGTATARIALPLATNSAETPILNKNVIFSGCPSNGSLSTYFLQWYDYDGSSGSENDVGNGTNAFTPTSTAGSIAIVIQSGINVDNLVFKPMVRLSTVIDNSYEPYENICPISGRTEIGILGLGRNQCNVLCGDFSHGGITFTNNGNGTFELHGTSTTAVDFRINQLTRTGKDHLTTYFVNNVYTCQTYTDKFKVRIMQDQTWASVFDTGYSANPVTQTISETKDNCFILVTIPTGKTFDHETFKIMLELGSDASSWGKSQDLTISLGQTVYGGTLDVENGVLSVLNGKKKVSDLSFSTSSYNNIKRYKANVSDIYRTGVMRKLAELFCEKYETISDERYIVNCPLYCIYTDNGDTLYITDQRYIDVTDFETNEADTEIVYKLATPITINLTPHTINLLKGVNNISTDGDSITLTYRDGSVATLGDLTSAVDSLDGKIENSQILTDTATGDKYILVVTNGVLSVEQISN